MSIDAAPVPAPVKRAPMGRRELIAIVALMMSMNALAIDTMLPALDDIARDLDAMEGNQRQLVIGVYTIVVGIGCLVPGSFADRFGRRPVVLASLGIYSLMALLAALATNFHFLLAVRGLAGLLAAGLIVAPNAIIRDRYEGDEMAGLMSLIAAVFVTVPVVAPTLGHGILLFAGWRWIFAIMAILSAMLAVWVWLRLPETLAPENRQKIDMPVILRNMRAVVSTRSSIGYVLGAALVLGAVFGYVNSAQQLYQENFGIDADTFPILFGATAALMAITNLVNSRIVTRFGARRVSHAGVLAFIIVSSVQVWSSYAHPANVYWFVSLTSINIALLGFLMANFSSIAMQPFARTAGAASSVQTFLRMFGAAIAGVLIGQAFDGTARPFAWSLFVFSICAFVLVFYSERGKLLPPPRGMRHVTRAPGMHDAS